MKPSLNFKAIKIIWLLLACFCYTSYAQVAVSGASSGINTNYTTLRTAFAAINGASQTGNAIVITINSDTDESTLTAVLNAGTWTSLTIKPTGARTISGATAAGNPIINLNGADNVTIDGLNTGGNSLLISNTTASSTTSTSTIRFIADATQNTITNCTIAGSDVATAGGIIYFAGGTTTGNDNNTISNCTITAAGSNLPINAIYSNGTSTTVDNSNNTISNNKIQDYFHDSVSSSGINLAANSATWTISGNRFFQTATRTTTSGSFYIRGILINTASAGGYTITNNTIGFANASGAGTSTFNGTASVFYRGLDITTNTTSSSIQGNVIAGINFTTAITNTYAPGSFVGIYVSGVANIGTTSGNTIGSSSSASSIVITVIQPAIPVTTASRSTGIYVATNSATSTIQNNTVAGISTTGLDTNGYGFYGINTVGTLGDFVITNNTIGSATVAHSIAMGTSGVTASGVCTFYGITNASTGTATITNNTIVNCTAYGTATSALSGLENISSSTLVMDYNTVDSMTLTGTGTFRGLYNGAAASTASMSYNTIRNYSLQNATSIFTGIQNNGVVTGTITINNNKLGDATAGLITFTVASTANFYGIYNSSGTTGTALYIQNNDFRGITYSATSSGSHTYIYNTNATLSQNISSNTFTNLNVATSGSVNFISDAVVLSASGNQTVSYNSIVGSFNKTVAGGNVTAFTTGVASATGATVVNNYNNFSYITVTGATNLTGWSQRDTGSTVKSISYNTFSNWTGGTNQIVVMYLDGFGSSSSVSNNSITGITGQNSIIGINITGVGSASDLVFANNTINNISSTGTGGTVTGIQCNTSVTALSIYSNSINTLSSVGASTTVNGIQVSGGTSTVSIYSNTINSLTQSGTTGPSLNGIYISAGNTVYLYKNKIYDLTLTNNTTGGGGIGGILINGANAVTAYNNIIGDLKAPLNGNTNVIKGISVTTPSATSTYELDNNTIYLNATSSGTNFGSSGIFHTTNATSTISNLTLKNNLVINNSTANGTGVTAAYYRSSTELSNYNSASNNNLFYAGTPSTTNLVFYNGTRYQVLSAFQTLVSPRDSASKTENTAPFFHSTTTSDANYLRIPAGTTTHAESAAVTVTTPSINTDYWNVTRPFPSPTNGGTASDIGASEFDGIAANCLTPSGQPTAFTSGTNTATTIVGSFTTASGTPTGYLVVKSLGTLTANPTDGTVYSLGSSLGNGTVIQSSSSLSFSTASLTPNTTFTLTIFAYNTGVCSVSITKYLTTAPLVGTLTTCSAAPTGSANQAFCGAKKLTDIVTSGTAVKYYAAASGGSSIVNTTAIVYPSTYYISQTINGCESQDRLMVTITETTTAGDQVTYGTDSWIGYVYSPISTTSPPADAFTTTYQGYVTQSEQFDQNYAANSFMSGTSLCNSFTINYAIKFKMTKSFAPDYYKVTTGADDGYRFSIDGGTSYVSALSNWTTHAYSTTTSTVYLNGSTNLVFDYYQQPAISRIVFNYVPCNSSTAPTAISGTVTICNGSSTTLTVSGGTLSAGAVYQWGTGAVVGSNIIAGQSGASITVSPSSTTTYWVNRLDGAPCNLSTTGVTLLVTVVSSASNSTAPTTISGATTLCNGSSTILTASGGTLGAYGAYQWGTGTVGTNSISGQTSAAITISPASITTYWVRRVDSFCSNTTTGISQIITVSPASVGGTTSGNQTVCTGSSASDITLSGNVGTVIKWQKSTDNFATTSTDIANTSTTLTSAQMGGLSPVLYFRAVVQNGACATSNSTVATVSISSASVGGSLSSSQTICTGSLPADLSLTSNVGNVIYWQKSATTNFASPTTIGGTSTTLAGTTIGALTTITYIRAVVQNSPCSLVYSNYVTIDINSAVSNGGTASADQELCSGTSPSDLSVSGYTGAIVKWQKATTSDFSTPTDLAVTTDVLGGATIGNLSTTTYFRVVVQNGSCSTANSNYVTVVVNTASVGGTVITDEHIGYNTQPSTFTLSANNGAVLNWQKATNTSFTSATNISNTANTLSGATIGNLTTTTYFRAIVQNGVCSSTPSDYVTVTVDPASVGGTVTSNQSICTGTSPATLTLASYTGTIQRWESATEPTFSSPTTIANATTTLSGLSALSQTTYYRAVVKNGLSPVDYSSYASITVNPATVGGTVGGSQTICSGTQPGDLTLSGHTGSVVKWQSATNSSFTANLNDITGSTSTVLTSENMGTLSTTTYYRAMVQSGVCSSAYSAYAIVTVTTVPNGGTVGSSQSICTDTTPTDLTLTGNTGTIVKWQYDYLSDFSTAIDINNSTATLTGASIGNLSATTYFRAVVQNGGCYSVPSTGVTITVAPSTIAGSLSADQLICSGTSPATITLTGAIGTVVKWQKSATTDFASATDIAVTTATLTGASIGTVSAITYIRAVVQSGNCSAANSAYLTIAVNPASIGGSVAGGTSICSGTSSEMLTLSGQTGTIVRWESAVSPFNTWTTIANTSNTYTSGVLSATTQFRAVVQNGSCATANSSATTVTITAMAVGGTVSSDQTLCAIAAPANLSLSGETGTVSKWQKSLTADFATVIDIPTSATTLTGATIGEISSTTYFRAVVQNAGCSTANSNYVTINVNLTLGGSVSGTATICLGSQATDLTLSGYSGSIVKWQKAVTLDFASPIDIASTAATLTGTTIGTISATTYFRAVILNGSCGTIYSSTASMNITTTTWNGTSWDNGAPTAGTRTIMTGNYTSPGGGVTNTIYMCNLVVTNGANVTVVAGDNFVVTNSVTVDSGSSLTFESNANLVQIDNVSNTGNIIVQRDTNPQKRMDYVLWSSPVVGQNLKAFSPLTISTNVLSRFYSYNSYTDQYKYIFTPEAYTFTKGNGYLIRMPNTWSDSTSAVFNGQFTGMPNNGDITVSVIQSGATDGGTHTVYPDSGSPILNVPNISTGYNAIGNPYPSTINADNFISANGIAEALYFWRKTNNTTTSSYATYTYLGGTANTGGSSNIAPNGIIQVGQGFIIKATSSSVTFTNTMRIANNNGQFLKSSGIEKHRIWLNLFSDNEAYNQTLIGYMTGATNDLDARIDGKYINDCSTALNSYLNNGEYIIQGRSLPFTDADVVPLTFKNVVAGNYTIAIDHVDGLFSGSQDIYLKDNLTNVVHDLKQSAYTFASDAGVFNNRFELVYNSSPLITQNPTFNENSVVIYKQNEVLNVNSGSVNMKEIKIFDIRGRLLYDKSAIGATSLAIKDLTAEQQVLIVQITSEDGKRVTKKIVY
jgi:hypothetical protein